MNKQLTAGRVIRYLLYLCIVCTMVFGVTYARYFSEIQGRGTVSTAAVAMNVTNGTSTLDLTKQLQGLRPGEKKELDFAVTNEKENIVSEVAQEYSITVSATGNLPLTYALEAKDKSGTGTYVKASADGSLTWAGGLLPYSEKGIAHTYTLTVAWPSGQADESLADEIDLIVLTVDAKQAMPTEN